MFWRGEISHLAGWNNVVGQVVDAVVGPIKSFFIWVWDNLIRPGIQAIIDLLKGALDLAIGAVKWVVDGISSTVTGIASWLAEVGNAIYQVVRSVVAQISSAVSGILSKIGEGVNWLAGELTKAAGWIWQQMQGFFSAIGEVLKQIGVWIINAIKTYVVDPLMELLKPVFDGLKQLIMALWNFMTGGAVTGSPIEWRGSFTRWLGILSGVGVMAVSGFIGAAILDVVHPMKDTRAKEVAEFAMRFSGITFLQAAFFTTYFDIACAKPVRQELNAIFAPEIPGSMDLIRFVVREVIVPDEFYVAMSLQGFSRYWSEAYWEAHWMLPPPERTRTAFLRKQIPEADYRKFLIWYDFKPEPRPGVSLSDVDIMLQTQYEWPERIDTRWLIEWGIITPQEGVDLIKAGGMDPAWAPRVAEAYLLNQVREELGKVRAVYERRLREGFMSKAGFAEALYSLHYAAHVVNALERWADEELDLQELLDEAKEYEALAKDAVITVTEYGQALRDLGMTEDRITRAQKHIERLLAIKAAKEAAKAKG